MRRKMGETNEGNHLLDALRYAIMSRPYPEEWVVIKDDKSKEETLDEILGIKRKLASESCS